MTIYHKHHIIPKHMGGSDDPTNLIELTIEEHAEAHKKLWEEHGNEYDRIAWLSLTKQIDCAEARILSVIEWNKNRTISDETREKLSKRMKEHFSDPENRKKVSESTKKGYTKWWNSLTIEEQNDWKERCKKKPEGWIPHSGWTYSHTDEAKAAISKAQKNRKRSKEEIEKIKKTKKERGCGIGERNAMAKEENRQKVAQSKIGRKRVYQPDGSFKYLFPSEIGG